MRRSRATFEVLDSLVVRSHGNRALVRCGAAVRYHITEHTDRADNRAVGRRVTRCHPVSYGVIRCHTVSRGVDTELSAVGETRPAGQVINDRV